MFRITSSVCVCLYILNITKLLLINSWLLNVYLLKSLYNSDSRVYRTKILGERGSRDLCVVYAISIAKLITGMDNWYSWPIKFPVGAWYSPRLLALPASLPLNCSAASLTRDTLLFRFPKDRRNSSITATAAHGECLSSH